MITRERLTHSMKCILNMRAQVGIMESKKFKWVCIMEAEKALYRGCDRWKEAGYQQFKIGNVANGDKYYRCL